MSQSDPTGNISYEPGEEQKGPPRYVVEVCKLGQREACCRYLGVDMDGFTCLKWSEHHATLDVRAEQGLMSARADNCEGRGVKPRMELA